MDMNDKKYILKTLAETVFCCYEGEKDPQKLVEYPMLIKKEDFNHIALPSDILETPKRIIFELQEELRKASL